MMSHGFKRTEFDSCVYINFVDGSPIYLLLYVDDMLIAAKSKIEITKLKKLLSSGFDMKDLGSAKKILGILVNKIISRKFFSVSTCKMLRLLVPLLHLTLSCQLLSVLVQMQRLNTCQGFLILVLLGL